MYAEQRTHFEEKYTGWLIDSGELIEKPKIKNTEVQKGKKSIKKSFRSLEID